MVSETRRELEALKREVEGLRAERRDALAGAASQFGIETGQDTASSASTKELFAETGLAAEWGDLKQLAHEIADELGETTREHPALGIGGAFILGVLVGRMLPR